MMSIVDAESLSAYTESLDFIINSKCLKESNQAHIINRYRV
jgi:hypothetical protein